VDEFASVIFLFPDSWQSHLSTLMAHVSHKDWADVAMLPVMLLSAFYQELLMRGYFITRFEQLFHSIPFSIVGAAALFAFWHTYQGPWGVMGALISGLIYGAIFVKTRRLPPLVLGHALWNFVAHT
jgi:membrane protease YdiL (CAAX protease family)